MKEELTSAVVAACQELFDAKVSVELTRPDEQFGDYATNVALQLSKQLGKNNPSLKLRTASPREIGQALAEKLRGHALLADVRVAGPGFLNLTLADSSLFELAETKSEHKLAGQKIVVEYSDPNPFKVLHAGHIYTSVVGDAIANLLENAGGEVHRVNYGGDVGLHVGKTMWAILKMLGGENPDKLGDVPEGGRAEWMAQAYVEGTSAYEDDEAAKAEIITLNKRVYQLHARDEHDSPFAQIYWTCRTWSYDYFNAFYARIGTKFEKYYPESTIAELGLKTVRKQVGKVFSESDGAIIFKGEEYGLHTRVFISSEGIPTYEAKDVGLVMQKKQDYDFDRSVVITGNEQLQYMQVVLKAIEQFAPELAKATSHFTHGLVKLQGGVKMSSRKGNILRAVDVLDAAAEASKRLTGNGDEQTVLAAVKYAFLKQRLGGDIIYDPEESVAIEGNSGPYIQYAHARARSILRKTDARPKKPKELESDERSLLRKIGEYPEVVEKATSELLPHYICTYLYELAQTFNRFYEKNRVIGDPRQNIRLQLVTTYADTLKDGLGLLGIHAPDKM
jgi:arginyl-tRNA synthetase